MRLIARSDTPLVVGLIAGSLVLFQQPLRFVLDAAREIEGSYNLDLVPTLVMLSTVFVFHQNRKRLQMQAQMMAAAAEAREHLARTRELEALVTFGRRLASALDDEGLRYAVSRCLPEFVGDRGLWVLVKQRGSWELLASDPATSHELPREALEGLATAALAAATEFDGGPSEGVVVESSVCFPMTVGSTVLGVLGVQEKGDRLDARVRRALGVTASLLGIAVRNVRLLLETRELSVNDALTGCLNRKPGLELLDKELHRAERADRPLSLLMLDVDGFKAINDHYGHLCGDHVLAAIGLQFTQCLRISDARCRYGGDEFILILPDTPLEGAERVAASLGSAARLRPIDYNGHEIPVTLSIGVACAGHAELDAKRLIERADRALYAAKNSGRNCWRSAVAQGAGSVYDSSVTPGHGAPSLLERLDHDLIHEERLCG